MTQKIKDLTVIVPALITLLAFLIKFIKNFFFECVKAEYRSNIGEISTFEAVINLLLNILICLELVLGLAILAFIIYLHINGKKINFQFLFNNKTTQSNANYISNFLYYITMGIYIFSSITTIRFFYKLKKEFIRNFSKKDKKIRNYKLYKSVNGFNKISSAGLMLAFGAISYSLIKESMNYKYILLVIGFTVYYFILFLVTLSLEPIIKDLSNTIKFTLKLSNEDITCNCYLEYNKYYLIYDDEYKMERYIAKNEVKEIQKEYIKTRLKRREIHKTCKVKTFKLF